MLGTDLRFSPVNGEERFRNPAKPHRLLNKINEKNNEFNSEKFVTESRTVSNLDRFLESTTPITSAQNFSKEKMSGRSTDVELSFTLGDLWESFKEWSAYGAGVPIVLNGSNSVVQYYVPYLSGIQLYGDSKPPNRPYRKTGEDDNNHYRDSSSDESFDRDLENCAKSFSGLAAGLNGFSSTVKHIASQEGFSINKVELENSQGSLLFEFLEHNPPYCREPLSDKISDLSRQFPGLKTLRSCELSPSSWVSVAWYPIYRIPTGTTLMNSDACFLTYHFLSTQEKDTRNLQATSITYFDEIDGVLKISLPVFGLACYKLKGTLWCSNGGSERRNSLLLAANNWLRHLHVTQPDFQFFSRR